MRIQMAIILSFLLIMLLLTACNKQDNFALSSLGSNMSSQDGISNSTDTSEDTSSGVSSSISSGNSSEVSSTQTSSSSTSSNTNTDSKNQSIEDKILVNGQKIKGGVVCDYIPYRYWAGPGQKYDGIDFLKIMKNNGMNAVRVGVTTEYNREMGKIDAEQWRAEIPWNGVWSNRESALQIFKEAKKNGLKKNLFFMLSDGAAHGGIQKIPSAWKSGDVTVDSLCKKLEKYCYDTVKYFKDQGIDIDIYEIGNEINLGILEYRPGEKVNLPAGVDLLHDPDYMFKNVWNIEAELLSAAIKGVRRADADAVVCLHIAGLGMSQNETHTSGFFNAMKKYNVDYDLIGLSYYWDTPERSEPSQPYYKSAIFNALIKFFEKDIGKKVIISEFAYPATNEGQKGVNDLGYEFTEEGQAAWLRDFLDFVEKNETILGTYYFYPEYYDGIANGSDSLLEACGLMKNPTTVMKAFKEYK